MSYEVLYSFIVKGHLMSTLLMTGLIYVIQWVHYPLFKYVGANSMTLYHTSHVNRITWLVAPLMLFELISGMILYIYCMNPAHEVHYFWALLCTVIIWLSTAFLQVPAHNKLSQGFDVQHYNFLVNSNWVRTIMWSIRSGIVISIC